MDSAKLDRARQFAVDRLKADLPDGMYYHSFGHTADDVVPAAARLAVLEGLVCGEVVTLLTAAWFHDLGFVEVRNGHEAVGARIAAEVLPGFGYDSAEIAVIQSIIMATKIPQSATTLSERIMADADLDLLGREDFPVRNNDLRRELACFGAEFTEEQWLTGQLRFISSHKYFTNAARDTRDAGQAANASYLAARLDDALRPESD